MTRQKLMKLADYQICVISELDNRHKNELGTGFSFLKKEWIVTAKHVVMKDGIPRENLVADFYTLSENTYQSINLKVLAIHIDCDIAILEITDRDHPCDKPFYPGFEELNVAEGLLCFGYTPSEEGITISGELIKQYTSEERERSETETIFEFNDAVFEPGSSGGPILGNGGVVLGLLINLISDEAEPEKNLIRATSIMNLVNNVEFEFNSKTMKCFTDEEE